jgi:hypothetical protein
MRRGGDRQSVIARSNHRRIPMRKMLAASFVALTATALVTSIDLP